MSYLDRQISKMKLHGVIQVLLNHQRIFQENMTQFYFILVQTLFLILNIFLIKVVFIILENFLAILKKMKN